MGMTTWKYDAAWPAVYSWQYVDWYLNVGGAYYGAKKACEPLHVQYSYDDNSIYVINSYYKDFKDLKVVARLLNLDLSEKFNKSSVVNVSSDGKTEVFKIEFPEGLCKTFFLKLSLEDNTGKLISDNFYWLSTQKDIEGTKQELKSPRGFDWDLFKVQPKSVADFTALNQLPQTTVEKSVSLQENGSETKATVNLKNTGSSLAFMVHLSMTKGEGGDEIDPAYWDDNYFSLLPGESREIKVRFKKEDQGNTPAVLKVDGWNIKD
ncbi:MAG TPA: glycoside hydrolase family 2 protein, partial [Bacteroidales bacterium]|nr:glycoside hydrolase family 2 protein [Bacteroidales bacterium]